MASVPQQSGAPTKGGWITFPFIITTMAGLTLSAGGWTNNLVVYLINEFNIKSIDATQITNIFKGCMNLFPILGAIFADSYFGLFSVISISTLSSLLGIILLTFTAILNPLKPAPCEKDSSLCVTPSNVQLAILYTSLALTSIGVAGTRFLLSTLGANQFDKPKQQGVFFNWYFFTLYVATLISMVGIVYVEDNVGWGLGYGLCVAANLIGLVVFVLGKRYYLLLKPQGSPFTELARVAVAAFRKRKVLFSLNTEDYWQGPHDGETKFVRSTPTNSFRFLNHAALVTQGDTTPDGSIKKPWNLCTLQQVEDLKTIIRIIPLWTTGIFLFTPIAIQTSLIVLQALAMDRHLGPHFQIPAGSMLVFVMLSTSIFLTVIDRFLIPLFQKITGIHPTPLQRIGVGHALVILSMAISALVESKRLSVARANDLDSNSVVPMSAFWIAPQLVILGVAEAFYLPGQVSLYYQEFPKALKSTSSALVSMLVGIAFYLGTVVVDLISKITRWLPDGINDGRMDNMYWVLTVIVLINFGYYLVCSWLYKYQNVEKKEVPSSDPC